MAIILGAGAILTAAAGLYFLLATMHRRQRRAILAALDQAGQSYRNAQKIDPTGREYPSGNKWERGF